MSRVLFEDFHKYFRKIVDDRVCFAESISYCWHNGMKEPMIRTKGDRDEDTLNNFFNLRIKSYRQI